MGLRGWAAAGLAALALSGCGSTEPRYLADLREDPVARWEPEGGRLLRSSSTEAQTGSSARKARAAVLLRTFSLPSADAVAQAQRAGAAYAQQQGWVPQSVVPAGTRLSRPAPDGRSAELFLGPALEGGGSVLTVELRTAP